MEKLLLSLTFLTVNGLFFPLRRRPIKYYWQTRVDNKIPLVPWMVVPYLSYFLLLLFSLSLYFSSNFVPFIKSMIIAQAGASLVWYFFPNGIRRPEVTGQGRTDNWLKWLYNSFSRYDGNAFPSAHTYQSLIIGSFLTGLFPQTRAIVSLWVALILVSTVLTKQHYIMDVAGGVLLAMIAVQL